VTLAETVFLRQPWLITPDALASMVVAARAFLDAPPKLPPPPESSLLALEDGIGVLSIRGPIIRHPDPLSVALFGALDTEAVSAAVREAGDRADVQAVLLDIDSPGGTVSGTPELAQGVLDLSQKKPVYAFSAGQMCSAAYWVASQAQAIYATPSARVGSIGVILPFIDSSEAFKQAGLKVEVFAAGKFKSAGTPGVPLTDAQRALLQSDIEDTAAEFRAAVLARGRKIPPEAMEGQTIPGRLAQRFNLAGMVRDRAEAMSRLRRFHVAAQTRPSRVDNAASVMSKTVEEQLQEALARIQKLEGDAQASTGLLAEAGKAAEASKAQIEALGKERDQHAADLGTARKTIESLTARNAELEAAEKDIEKRAAKRSVETVAATGTQAPAKVSPAGDRQTTDIVAQFKAITDPKEQTLFWRNLTPQQRALILASAS